MIDTTNINTKGAVVTVAGVAVSATSPDGDGFYWGTISGHDIGCTVGGVQVSYTYETQDIFCDQSLAAVETAIISEAAEVTFSMLETDVENLQYALQTATYLENANVDQKIGVGGSTLLVYIPLKLEIADNDTENLTTWTFHRCLANGFNINFERENPSQADVTFTAYAKTAYTVGHQLFSIHADIS